MTEKVPVTPSARSVQTKKKAPLDLANSPPTPAPLHVEDGDVRPKVSAGAYLVSAATHFAFPAWYQTVFWGAAPLYGLGEIGIIGWLLIKGAREDIVTA